MKFIQLLGGTILAAFTFTFLKQKINYLLMSFFRNLGRYKIRKRLYGNQAALIPVLFGYEDIIESNIDIESLPGITISELGEMDGRTEEVPIYLAINGSVFDVSESRDKYGPTGKYKAFAGRDVTVALSIPCTTAKCMAKTLNRPFTISEQKSIERWVEFFTQHDKYKLVGRLVSFDPIDVFVDRELLREDHSATEHHSDINAENVTVPIEIENENNQKTVEVIEMSETDAPLSARDDSNSIDSVETLHTAVEDGHTSDYNGSPPTHIVADA